MKFKLFLCKPFWYSVLSFFLIVSAGSAQSITGDWYSKLQIQGIELRLNIHILASGDGFTGSFDSPDQGAFDIPLSSVTFTYPDLAFSHESAGFKYTGKVNSSYTAITGKFEQSAINEAMTFQREPIAAATNSQQALSDRYDKQEVYITMRDGVRLFTSIYTPKDISEPRPILLNRTPYDIEPRGPSRFNNHFMAYKRYTDDNYIMVYQDVRGRYMSEGDFEDIRPVIPVKKSNKDTDESTDTWDTVDWLVKNVKNNNGKVGIFGISYPGFYSTMGIINAHPAVKAVSPQAPVTAWFIGDDFNHNGAFFVLDCFPFYYSFGQPRRELTRASNPGFRWPVPDNYEFFLDLGAVKNIAPKYFGDSIKFWNDAFSHPDYDDFWKSRDPRQYLKNVTPAVMTVGGWFDAEDLYGTLHTYKAIESQNPPETKNYIVMGPWSHGQWSSGSSTHLGNIYWGLDANAKYATEEEKFFNYFLDGKGTGDFPEAMIFVTGSNEWKEFSVWPPSNTIKKKLYLRPDMSLSFDMPSGNSGFDEYVSDPMHPVPYTEDVHARRTAQYMTDDQRFASRRPDVMTYKSDILSEDITLTGPLTADLFVSTTGTDADFIVKLIDVFPPDARASGSADISVPLGGYEMLVRGEVFRGKYRNSFEKPEPFVPGKVTEVKYEMPDIAHTFKKGHRIMIQIQNSWFPLVDRNPQKFVNIYKCSDSDFQKATERIYHDSSYPSNVSVTVLQ